VGEHLIPRPSKYPKYTHGFVDRHGRPRFYFRRRGYKKIPLPGLPWSPEFMQAYEAAIAGQPIEIGSTRVKPGSMRALAVSYYSSLRFQSMRPSTRSVRRNVIERFCRQSDQEGHQLGDKSAATIRREHIIRLMAARAEKPESANALRNALRALMQHAVELGMRPDDPTRDVRTIRVKSDGFHSWTEAEIEQFERCHAVGSKARLALALLLYTGQRRSDVVVMGRQHIRDGAIHVRQIKTGAPLQIPVCAISRTSLTRQNARGWSFSLVNGGARFPRGISEIGSDNAAMRLG
jgi:integrase